MIKLERVSVAGFEPAVRGMRNPKNSWDKSDSHPGMSGDEWSIDPGFIIGEADKKLMVQLAKGGSVHAKYRRQIVVWVDITAPLYFWKEFDTYKVGTVSNSCSTMHKLHSRDLVLEDFSYDHLRSEELSHLVSTIDLINSNRQLFTDADGCKEDWFQMVQLLPSSYNQKRTVMLSYEVLTSIYRDRKNHKLDEWQDFCKWAESLPYSWCFTLNGVEEESRNVGKVINRFTATVDIGSIPVSVMHPHKNPLKMDLYLENKKIGSLVEYHENDEYSQLVFDLIPEIHAAGLQREWWRVNFSYGYTINEDEDIIQMRLYRKESDDNAWMGETVY